MSAVSPEPCWPSTDPGPCGWRSSNEYWGGAEHTLVAAVAARLPGQRVRAGTCILMLDKMMRRVIRLSEAELRSLSKFLFMRYCLNAVWIVLAARRDTKGPPYFLSSIST